MLHHVHITCVAKLQFQNHQRKSFPQIFLLKFTFDQGRNTVYYMWLTACFSSSLYFHTPFPFSTFSLYLFLCVCLVHVQIGAYNISEVQSYFIIFSPVQICVYQYTYNLSGHVICIPACFKLYIFIVTLHQPKPRVKCFKCSVSRVHYHILKTPKQQIC